MTPLRFQSSGGQLFGIEHPPLAAARNQSVLLCNPFGQEAIRCHRLLRVLAVQLARQGFHVLRFDYFGTGDADGADGEGSLARWAGDVLAADAVLRARSGCERSTWLGLRLGASIAALATQRSRQRLHRLILWDPVIDGTDYLATLHAAHLQAARNSFGTRWGFDARLRARVAAEADDEALGFTITSALRAELQELSAASLGMARADDVAVLGRADTQGMPTLCAALDQTAGRTGLCLDPTYINWLSNEAIDSSIAPATSLKLLTQLMTKAA